MIDLFKVFFPKNLSFKELEEILQSGKLNAGRLVNELEEDLKKYIGNPNIMIVGNNIYAPLISLTCLGVGPGCEVISSPMACLASNMPVLNVGANIVWADIDPNTGTLDPDSVKQKISSKTKAILHYHWCGYPGYIDEINKIGKNFGIPIIDDAIESFGSKYKGKLLGNTGTDITTFSLQTVRLPNSIDGGAIAFQSKSLFEKALRIRDFGIDRSTFRDKWNEISPLSDIPSFGYNAVMSDLNAYIGREVLNNTESLLLKQNGNAKVWDKYCDDNGYKRLNVRKEIEPNYWVYSFRTSKQDTDLKDFRAKGYYASKIHLRNDYYSCFGKFNESLKGVKDFASTQLSVPSGWWFETNK